jgi:hypothetical protein
VCVRTRSSLRDFNHLRYFPQRCRAGLSWAAPAGLESRALRSTGLSKSEFSHRYWRSVIGGAEVCLNAGAIESFVLSAVLLSLGGILIGAFVTEPADGGRGGAIAVALAFLVLFVRRGYGARVYEAIARDLPAMREEVSKLRQGTAPATANAEDLAQVKRQVTAIVSRIDTEADGQKIQNRALAWASCIGTIAWGFGDMLAKWLSKVIR